MHFHQEKTQKKKNLLKRHHSPLNYQFKGCTAETFNSCISCFRILTLTGFTYLQNKSFENTVGKGEIACKD